MKVLCVLGTRPEAIKFAPVIRELKRHPSRIQTRVCVTGQHREMLDQILNVFQIRPDADLDIMEKDQTLTDVTVNALTGFESILSAEKPDWVLVQGDTTSGMVASLVAFYHRVKIGHIEAGLRTWNTDHPFPEEINRKFIDALASFHFAPTEIARQNLLREGTDEKLIAIVGNTVIDALHWIASMPLTPVAEDLLQTLGINNDTKENAGPPYFLLVTAHRRESFGQPLENICRALRDIATRYKDQVRIIFPVHRNPKVQRTVHSWLTELDNVRLLPPLGYLELIQLMNRCYLILTDSGGIQEEAPALGKPVLVLRETTERPESISAGTAKLVGTDSEKIVEQTSRLLEDRSQYESMARPVSLYGDGHASERIVQTLLRFS